MLLRPLPDIVAEHYCRNAKASEPGGPFPPTAKAADGKPHHRFLSMMRSPKR